MSERISKVYEHLRALNRESGAAGEPESGDGTALEGAAIAAPGPEKVLVRDASVALVTIDIDDLEKHGLIAPGSPELIDRQFRRIKRRVINNAFDLGIPRGTNANVVAICSALPEAGKSFVSINLALSIAKERDLGVVIVDADVLNPTVTVSLKQQDRPGLLDFLDNTSMSIDDVVAPTTVPQLSFVSMGRRHPDTTEMLGSTRMADFVSAMSNRLSNSIVLFDTPPLLPTTEAQVLAEHAGQIVLVIQEGVTSQGSVEDALTLLDRDKPINAILNKASGNHASYDGYYGDPGYPR